MRSREKRNLVSSKDEKKQHRVRVLRGEVFKGQFHGCFLLGLLV